MNQNEGHSVLRPFLLVEDNPNDVELTLIALEKTRLANPVVSLRDGEEALQYLRREGQWANRSEDNPAVILLDKKLPKIDGHEVLKALRADDKLKRIPVVMLTSSREESDLLRSYDLGVNAYVVKPVAFDDFMAAINDLGVFWGVLNEPPPYPR
ncbi:response regulator receiver protein [Paraburkholderia phytofirmans PsJN]|uniref:Response regulator receiver protein n=1 Tax=Paraburkholderia phytofirmans (strain DSM 17436 / LMG 22146 / PsJN) TaxID=398527 RepID=B2T287_PARPJ|nr:response regulator receiver protein [Paraburkholderia phytofirmans PsJN]